MVFYNSGREVIQLIASNTSQLYTSYDTLKAICTSLSAEEQTIFDIQRQLSTISGMENICHFIHTITATMDTQIEQCKKLYQSLDTICQMYAACENRVLDYCEGTLIHYEQPPTEFINLASTANLLRNLSFHLDSGGEPIWP